MSKESEFLLEGTGARNQFANPVGLAGRSHLNVIEPLAKGSENIGARESRSRWGGRS